MEDVILNQVRDFCKKNGYLIHVIGCSDKNGVIATYPPNIIDEAPIKECVHLYTIEEDGVKVLTEQNDEENILPCPRYAARILIFQDILRNIVKRGVSVSLVTYSNELGEELPSSTTFADILSGPETKEEVKLEENLSEIFYRSYTNPSEDYLELAVEKGVEEGYSLLRSSLN